MWAEECLNPAEESGLQWEYVLHRVKPNDRCVEVESCFRVSLGCAAGMHLIHDVCMHVS